MTIERTAVNSSNIRSIGYDPDEKVMHVEFPGGVYVYEGVDPEVHEALISAPSIGSYFSRYIRTNFEARRLDAGESPIA